MYIYKNVYKNVYKAQLTAFSKQKPYLYSLFFLNNVLCLDQNAGTTLTLQSDMEQSEGLLSAEASV